MGKCKLPTVLTRVGLSYPRRERGEANLATLPFFKARDTDGT